jgi:hypothetical protein
LRALAFVERSQGSHRNGGQTADLPPRSHGLSERVNGSPRSGGRSERRGNAATTLPWSDTPGGSDQSAHLPDESGDQSAGATEMLSLPQATAGAETAEVTRVRYPLHTSDLTTGESHARGTQPEWG